MWSVPSSGHDYLHLQPTQGFRESNDRHILQFKEHKQHDKDKFQCFRQRGKARVLAQCEPQAAVTHPPKVRGNLKKIKFNTRNQMEK